MLPRKTGSNQLNYSEAKTWMIEFDARYPATSVEHAGNALMITQGQRIQYALDLPYLSHPILTITGKEISVRTLPGSKVSIFARVNGNHVKLSNAAHLLMNRGEEIKLSTYILSQQLHGVDYPQGNIFRDIHLLEASSIYSGNLDGLKYQGSSLRASNKARENSAVAVTS